MIRIVRLCSFAALVAAQDLFLKRQGGCSSALDCSLNGDCLNGACQCDAAWTGDRCDVMAFEETTPEATQGYHNSSAESWGGLPIKGEDGQWHLFHVQILNGCSLWSAWKYNSVVARSVAANPDGPYTFQEVVLPNFAHNPTIRKIGDDYVIWFIGGWPKDAKQCDGASVSAAETAAPAPPPGCGGDPLWPKSCGPEMPGPMKNTCGPGHNEGCGVSLAHSKSVFGPWTVQPLIIEDQWRSEHLYCAHTNPSPQVLHNGTVVMAFNAGYCDKNMETVGIAVAPHWSGPYTLLTPDPVFSNSDPADPENPHFCEDPFIWKSKRGWHLLTHNQQGPQGVSSYGYSLDAHEWHLSPVTPYNCTIRFRDGTSGVADGCGNRPQIFSDASGKPFLLINGADTLAGDSSTTKKGYTLFRHLQQ